MTFIRSEIALSVFCPVGWHGIKGIAELHIDFDEALPKRVRKPVSPVKPILLANAKSEFDRLNKYMYIPSTSPITSPLVIAMKPTPPGVRFCGLYDVPNKHIIYQQHYIPHVLTELTRAAKASYFHDLDMTHTSN
jgi:hypothetical protein